MWRAYAQDALQYGGGPAVHLARRDQVGQAVVTDMTFETLEVGEMNLNPPVVYGEEAVSFLQAIMDAAYDYGLRPSRAQDERHQKAHLSDLRTIAFHALKISK